LLALADAAELAADVGAEPDGELPLDGEVPPAADDDELLHPAAASPTHVIPASATASRALFLPRRAVMPQTIATSACTTQENGTWG
jgi:hypothetical protein